LLSHQLFWFAEGRHFTRVSTLAQDTFLIEMRSLAVDDDIGESFSNAVFIFDFAELDRIIVLLLIKRWFRITSACVPLVKEITIRSLITCSLAILLFT
jgi:hypothetical protein